MIKKLIPIVFLIIITVLLFVSCTNNGEHVHSYVETVYPANCQEMGYTQKLCTECGDELLTNYKPRSGHAGENWQITKEPTCQVAGTEGRICDRCNTTFETRIVAKLGHIEGKWVVTKAPTCKTAGTEKLFCNVCGIDLETKTLEVTEEHDFNTKVTPPTTENQGYTTYTCKVCDFTKKDDYVDVIETSKEITANDIYQKSSSAMVRVEAYDKNGKHIATGSGFFITADGQIATNYHVIEAAYSLKVKTYSGKAYDVNRILAYNSEADVAIIEVNVTNASYLTISTEGVKVGDVVYSHGSPRGVDNIFASGIVSNESINVASKDCIAFTAPISPGNSGGPLLNEKCEVVGINTMTILEAQNLNFAIKIKYLTDAQKDAQPIMPAQLYMSKLQENAFDILFTNIVVNAQSVVGDQCVIVYNIPETANEFGFDIYYVADYADDSITVKIYTVKDKKREYCVEFKMYQDSYKTFLLYDINLGQYTIESTVNIEKPSLNYSTDFDSLFSVYSFRYTSNDEIPIENMKRFYFGMYRLLVEDMQRYLGESNTGLTMSHLSFNV